MRILALSLLLACPLSVFANSELNGNDVTASPPAKRIVRIHFDKSGTPLEIAQLFLAAEDPHALKDSTPANEKNEAQGSPQWGFFGADFGGFDRPVYRGTSGLWNSDADYGGNTTNVNNCFYPYGSSCYIPTYFYQGYAYPQTQYYDGSAGGDYYRLFEPYDYEFY